MNQNIRRERAGKINGIRHFKGLGITLDSSDSGIGSNKKLKTDAQHLKAIEQKLVVVLDNQKHGTTNTYHCGCRCAECVAAHKQYNKNYNLKRKAKKLLAAAASIDLLTQ